MKSNVLVPKMVSYVLVSSYPAGMFKCSILLMRLVLIRYLMLWKQTKMAWLTAEISRVGVSTGPAHQTKDFSSARRQQPYLGYFGFIFCTMWGRWRCPVHRWIQTSIQPREWYQSSHLALGKKANHFVKCWKCFPLTPEDNEEWKWMF